MSQQPPESTDTEASGGDESRPRQDSAAGDERFVLAPEPPRKQRRWLDSGEQDVGGSDYLPRQFDLSSLPDEAEISLLEATESEVSSKNAEVEDGTPPVGFVSEPRRVQTGRAPRKPVTSASPDDIPPLGFVSEPRPVRPNPQAEKVTQPRLGFISRDEIEQNSAPDPRHSQAVVPEAESLDQPIKEQGEVADTRPLGYVSEPVVIARRPRETEAEEDAVAAVFDAPSPEAGLPPLEAEIEPEVLHTPPAPDPVVSSEATVESVSVESLEPARPLDPSPELASAMADLDARGAFEVNEGAAPGLSLSGEESASRASETAGMMLRRARKQQGLTLADIVLQTHMTLETVKALEEDRDPPQSAWVYVRGFYRRYAKVLGIPEAALLDAHQQSSGKVAKPEHVSLEWAPQDVSPQRHWPKHLLVVVSSVVLGVMAWWLLPIIKGYVSSPETVQTAKALTSNAKALSSDLASNLSDTLQTTTEKVKSKGAHLYQQAAEKVEAGASQAKAEANKFMEAAQSTEPLRKTKQQSAVSTASPVASQPAPDEVTQVEVFEAEDEPAEPAVTEPAPVEVAEPAVAQQSEATASQTEPESSAVPDPATGGLELTLSRQSWVSVTDVNGQLLFEGMLEGDVQQRFEGEPPLVLFLGTATAVKARYNGQEVDIASNLRPNGTARIVLGGE